jgi:hypothetical protein
MWNPDRRKKDKSEGMELYMIQTRQQMRHVDLAERDRAVRL